MGTADVDAFIAESYGVPARQPRSARPGSGLDPADGSGTSGRQSVDDFIAESYRPAARAPGAGGVTDDVGGRGGQAVGAGAGWPGRGDAPGAAGAAGRAARVSAEGPRRGAGESSAAVGNAGESGSSAAAMLAAGGGPRSGAGAATPGLAAGSGAGHGDVAAGSDWDGASPDDRQGNAYAFLAADSGVAGVRPDGAAGTGGAPPNAAADAGRLTPDAGSGAAGGKPAGAAGPAGATPKGAGEGTPAAAGEGAAASGAGGMPMGAGSTGVPASKPPEGGGGGRAGADAGSSGGPAKGGAGAGVTAGRTSLFSSEGTPPAFPDRPLTPKLARRTFAARTEVERYLSTEGAALGAAFQRLADERQSLKEHPDPLAAELFDRRLQEYLARKAAYAGVLSRWQSSRDEADRVQTQLVQQLPPMPRAGGIPGFPARPQSSELAEQTFAVQGQVETYLKSEKRVLDAVAQRLKDTRAALGPTPSPNALKAYQSALAAYQQRADLYNHVWGEWTSSHSQAQVNGPISQAIAKFQSLQGALDRQRVDLAVAGKSDAGLEEQWQKIHSARELLVLKRVYLRTHGLPESSMNATTLEFTDPAQTAAFGRWLEDRAKSEPTSAAARLILNVGSALFPTLSSTGEYLKQRAEINRRQWAQTQYPGTPVPEKDPWGHPYSRETQTEALIALDRIGGFRRVFADPLGMLEAPGLRDQPFTFEGDPGFWTSLARAASLGMYHGKDGPSVTIPADISSRAHHLIRQWADQVHAQRAKLEPDIQAADQVLSRFVHYDFYAGRIDTNLNALLRRSDYQQERAKLSPMARRFLDSRIAQYQVTGGVSDMRDPTVEALAADLVLHKGISTAARLASTSVAGLYGAAMGALAKYGTGVLGELGTTLAGLASKRLAAEGVLPRIVNYLGTRAAPTVAASSVGMGTYEGYQAALRNQSAAEIWKSFGHGSATGAKLGLVMLPVEPLLEFLPNAAGAAGKKAFGQGGHWWGEKAGELLQRQMRGATEMSAQSALQLGEARRPGQPLPTLRDYWSAVVESVPTGVAFGSLPHSEQSRAALKASPFAGEASPESAAAFVDRVAPNGDGLPTEQLRKLHELAAYQTSNPDLPAPIQQKWRAVARETARRQGIPVDAKTGVPPYRVEHGRRIALTADAPAEAVQGMGQPELGGIAPANPVGGGRERAPVGNNSLETGGAGPPGEASPGGGGKPGVGGEGTGSQDEPIPSMHREPAAPDSSLRQAGGNRPRSVRELLEVARGMVQRYAAAGPRLSAAIERAERGEGITELRQAVAWAQERAAKAEASRPSGFGGSSGVPSPSTATDPPAGRLSSGYFSNSGNPADPGAPQAPQAEASPRLRELPEDAARFWTDREHRATVFHEMREGMRKTADPKRIREMYNPVDRLLVAGLRSLGLERGELKGFLALNDSVMGDNAAVKLPGCIFGLNMDAVDRKIAKGEEDEILLDLIHESVHARAPFTNDYKSEANWVGYEEAAAETRSRSLAQEAGLTPKGDQYAYWVKALELLANALDVEPDRLAREMLTHPTGAVRGGFRTAVESVRGEPLSQEQGQRLHDIAEEVFAKSRIRHAVTDEELASLRKRWSEAVK